MAEKDDKELPKDLSEIQKRLRDVLSRRDEEIEMEFKKKDEQKEEVKTMTNPVGTESLIAELKGTLMNIQNEMKDHLNNLSQFQKDIEALAARVMEEITKATELSQKLEEIGRDAESRIASLKKEQEREEYEEAGVDFGQELARVKKIKEILEKEPAEAEKPELKEEERPVPEAEGETAAEPETLEIQEEKGPIPEHEEIPFAAESEPEEKEARLSPLEMEKALEEEVVPEKKQEPVIEETETMEAIFAREEKGAGEEPAPEKEPSSELQIDEAMETMFSGRWKKHWQDAMAKAKEKEETKKPEELETQPEVLQRRRASDFAELLEKCKKVEPPGDEDGVIYYHHNEKMILDSEYIISTMSKHLDEGKRLYIKLAQLESPKDQFFIKQEIIRHQEALREIFLIGVRMLEKEACVLPQFTAEIVSFDFLKRILERLSMENWSNQDDFTFFDEHATKVKSEFYERITPKVEYIRSIVTELGI